MTLTTQIANELAAAIRGKRWPVGTMLPSMRELARKHRVSLAVVQAAMRRLESQKLIEVRPRRGAVVRHAAGAVPMPTSAPRAHQVIVPFPVEGRGPVISYLAGDHYGYRILRAAHTRLAEAGYDLTLMAYSPEAGDAETLSPALLAKLDRAAGAMAGLVMFQGNHPHRQMQAAMDQRGVPCVIVDPIEREVYNYVGGDYYQIGRAAGLCMADSNRRPVHLHLPTLANHRYGAEIFAGFIQGYVGQGRSLHDLVIIEYESLSDFARLSQQGYERMLATLEQRPAPGGIFAPDLIAMGAMRACRDRGLRAPEDVAVMGHTGLRAAGQCIPSLTVVAKPPEDMGLHAAEQILAMIEQRVLRVPGKLFPARLTVRQSLPVSRAAVEKINREEMCHSFDNNEKKVAII